MHGGQWTAATLTKRSALTLSASFEERNAHEQCKSCNAGAGKYTAKESTVAQQYEAGTGRSVTDRNTSTGFNGPREMTQLPPGRLHQDPDEYRAKLKALKQQEAA